MYIGLGIVLLVLGAIIQFAYTGDANLGGVISVSAIGWILMIAGAAAILLSFAMRGRSRSGYSATRETHVDPATGSRVDHTDIDPR